MGAMDTAMSATDTDTAMATTARGPLMLATTDTAMAMAMDTATVTAMDTATMDTMARGLLRLDTTATVDTVTAMDTAMDMAMDTAMDTATMDKREDCNNQEFSEGSHKVELIF